MTEEERGGTTATASAGKEAGSREDEDSSVAAGVSADGNSRVLSLTLQNDEGKPPPTSKPETLALQMHRVNSAHEETPARMIAKADHDDTLSSHLDPWSRAGLQAVLDTARLPSKGFASSRVASYRPLGTPDIKRDRSLLPKSYMLYHSRYSQRAEESELEDIQADIEPLVLPMRLKGCYWNGERWCGTPFLPRLASARNGYEFLHEKIRKSHRSLIACRMGRYFLKSLNRIEAKPISKPGTLTRSRSYRPTVPKLNLRAVNQDFEYSKQLANNAALVFAYRVEAKRIASARSASISARPCNVDGPSPSFTKGSLTERFSCGAVPPEAVADASLRQLSNILDKETRFTAVQENLNRHLRQVSKAIESTRPFSYTRQFTSLKHLSPAQKSWKNRPTDSPRRAETFRRNLESHKWYEDLISMMFLGNRRPTKPEYDILDYIARALELGIQFNGDEYMKLLRSLEKRGADLNDNATSQALSYIRYALNIPDEVLLEGYLRKCAVIPAFLSSIDVPKNYSRLTSRLTSCSTRSQSVAT